MALLAFFNNDSTDSELLADIAGWLTVKAAAAAMGRTPRNIRKLCDAGSLIAVRTKHGWLIDPDCCPALKIAAGITNNAPAITNSPLTGISANKRKIAHARYTCITTWQEALQHKPKTMTTTEYLTHWLELWNRKGELKAIRSTLYKWQKRFACDGIAGLIDGRKHTKKTQCTPAAWDFFQGMYLDEACPAIPRLYERVAALAQSEGWQWPSLRTIQRWAKEKLDPKLAMAGRQPRRFRDRALPYVDRDWTRVPAMGCWVGDHRQLDIMIPRKVYNSKKRREEYKWFRPWLTMYLDARSWKPTCWTIRFESPDGNVAMGTFLDGVKEHGQPEHVYLDNGKDFRMYRFAGGRKRPAKKGEKLVPEKLVKPALELMGIKSTFAMPYNAKAKVIEPFFKIVSEQFDKTFETYCGRRADLRPERLKKIKPADYATRGLSLGGLIEAFNAWLTTDYELQTSPSKAASGLSVLRAFRELRRPDFKAVKPSDDVLSLLLMPSLPVVVSQNGIYVRDFGQHYWSDALEDRRCCNRRDRKRKIVYRYNPADETCIYVFNAEDDKFICVATPYIGSATHPLAESDHETGRLAAAIALQRHVSKTTNQKVRELRKTAGNKLLAASQQAGIKLGERDNPRAIADPPSAVIKLNGTGQLDRAARTAAKQKQQHEINQQQRETLTQEFLVTGTDSLKADQQELLDPLTALITKEVNNYE